MGIQDVITQAIKNASGAINIHLETPEIESHGDFSTNVAMVSAKKLKKNPKEIAEGIKKKLSKDTKLSQYVSKIEVAGPGFINFFLSKEYLQDNLNNVLNQKEEYGNSDPLKGKKYLLEHTSPNTTKTLHIGHLRNNVLGMALFNTLTAVGATVHLDSINNDRGIHVMKAVWAYNKFGKGKTPKSEKMKPDTFVDQYYVLGAKASKDEKKKQQMQDLLRKWEEGDKEVYATWKKLRNWTFEGFNETYKRIGSHHDKDWFESDFWKEGKEQVNKGLEKGVFKKLDDGAVLTDLSKYNLSDTIVLRADGTSMYHTQDLYLTQLKRKEFPSDLYIWDIGKDQILYIQQLFAMLEQLGIGKVEDYLHLTFGYILIKGKGKMSSRSGEVVAIDWLLDEVVKRASKINKKVAEQVGVGAVKYNLLKLSRNRDIVFDIDESLSLEGNSGPYLQYTYARTRSVLRKSKHKSNKFKIQKPNKEELALMRTFIHFQGVLVDVAENYSPNLLCNYLFDLAQKYNNFYNQHKIIGSDTEEFRLSLTEACGQILKNGLTLLGIDTPERM